MTPVAVDIRNVALSFGRTQVLRDINLAIVPGEFFALLGPSGSGKSTLLRLIAGFNRNQSGQVLIGGRDVSAVPPWQRDVGMVFQSYALWPHMTVAENVAFGLEERRLPRAEIRRKVAAVLELVELTGLEARRPGQLSGGQQQRVAIARTLAIEPQVLLLDEPLSNLDAKLRVQTRQELKKLQRRLNITTLFVTHDQEEAMTTADRMAVLDGGVLQQVGTPRELFDTPCNRFVAEFVGSTNLFTGRFDSVRRTFVADGLGVIPLPAGPATGSAISVRPHALAVTTERHGDRLWFDGEIEESEFLGEFTRYVVKLGERRLTADAPHLCSVPIYPRGARVQVGIDPGEVRVLP